jgi:hypothetical protein
MVRRMAALPVPAGWRLATGRRTFGKTGGRDGHVSETSSEYAGSWFSFVGQQAGVAIAGLPEVFGVKNSRKTGTSGGGWDYNVEIRESKKEIFVKMKANPAISFEISLIGKNVGAASESSGAGVSPMISHGQDGMTPPNFLLALRAA